MDEEIVNGRADADRGAARTQRLHPAALWFLFYSAASGAVEAMTADASEPAAFLLALQVAVGGFLIFWWANDDARLRGRPLARLAPLWIVLFGACWIVVRLFATREPQQAWRGLGRGVLVGLASMVLYLLFFTLFVPPAVHG
jgi:hypothetical protein